MLLAAAATDLWDAIANDEFNPCSWPFVECAADCEPNSNSNIITGMCVFGWLGGWMWFG